MPFFMYLTFRVGKVRREVSTETQKTLAELTAHTEETLSVSGILLSKTFGQQANSIKTFRGINAKLAALQIRQAMVGRWFFMIIGTIFTITPAFVYWLAGWLDHPGRPVRADDRRHRRLHHAPVAPVLPARPAAQRAGRDPGRARPVRPDLRVPRDGSRDRRRPGRGHARPRDGRRARSGFRDVRFHYPTAAVPSTRAHEAVAANEEAIASAVRRRRRSRSRRPRSTCRRSRSSSTPRRRRRVRPSRTSPSSTSLRRSALDGIDFEAEPGELVALVGPSGSGKTTTTYLIPRLYDVDAGAVEIDGIDVRRIDARVAR